MAGDSKTTDSAEETPAPVLSDPYPTIQATLDAMLADQRMVDWQILALATDSVVASNSVTQYPRFRCRHVILSTDTATTITINVGTAQYPFEADIGIVSFPFPLVIERGTSVSFTAQGGADANVYLIGPTE